MDEGGGAVMMAWEGPLMEAHAQAVCTTPGDILNVGFGLGLVDQVPYLPLTQIPASANFSPSPETDDFEQAKPSRSRCARGRFVCDAAGFWGIR